MCHFQDQNGPFVMNNFFWYKPNHYYYFHLPTDPFHCPKFKKLLQPIQNYEDVPFSGPKMAHLSWTKFFWYKPLLLLSSTYWPFSLCKILKNSSSGSRVMRMHNFWAKNGPFAQMRIFTENLLMSLVPFIYAYLHTKNQIQILIY